MNALIIANTQIRRDEAGRYCLNDIHEAAVAAGHDYKRTQVANWLRLDQTKELTQFLRSEELKTESEELEPLIGQAGRYGGTYAVKELVYAYAMWISASFHLHVIRAYDALVTASTPSVAALPPPADHVADLMVAADRVYRAVIRSGRARGLRGPRLYGAARAAAMTRTGIDLHAEHGVATDTDDAGGTLRDALSAQLELFWAAAQSGELGVPMCRALTTDVYALYLRWCRQGSQPPATLQRFVPALIRYAGLRQLRERWLDGERVLGPHGFLALSEDPPPPGVPVTTWNGLCVQRFRRALAEVPA